MYELCTSSGVLLEFMIYYGNMNNELVTDPDHFLTTEKIPITLLSRYLGNGHRLFIDNFYTTPRLADYLLQHNTGMVGTVRPNRHNFPKPLASEKLDKGQACFYKDDDHHVLAAKYRAVTNKSNNKEKVVHLITTCHEDRMTSSGKKDKEGQTILKPTCITDYNHKMGGVDLMDQQLDSMLVIRKSYKWYKKLFMRLLLQSALSAHKLYLKEAGKKDFLHFLHDVITELLTKSPKLQRVRSKCDNISRLTGRNHFPAKREYEGAGRKRKAKAKQCRVCRARGVTTSKGGFIETTWICTGCPSEPGLCLERGCFAIYHTKFDYSVM